MTVEFDPRIIRVGIEAQGTVTYYEGFDITAQGVFFGTDFNNPCQIRIDNLTREHRNQILTLSSPYRENPANTPVITLEAGRKSYGYVPVYAGQVQTSVITQPPDIGIILNCLTIYNQTRNIVSYNTGPRASLRSIAEKAAETMGVSLVFEATDKQISNFTLSGDALEFLQKMQNTGNYNVTVNNKTLIVKDKDRPLDGPVKEINESTGMIGIPEFTDIGVIVKFLFDNKTNIFQKINLTSIMNPAVNGQYQIYKLGFDIASRQTPFYWIAECQALRGGF